MDAIDAAQEREQRDRDQALQAQALAARIAASFAPRDPSLAGICADCDEPIEPERLAALRGATIRCTSCATDHEHRMKGYRS